MLDLEAIKARLRAATPGPWEPNVWTSEHDAEWRATGPAVPHGEDDYEPHGPSWNQAELDADLIAHAPTDLAALVAEVERLRGALGVIARADHRAGSDLINYAEKTLDGTLGPGLPGAKV